jgi:hypothetical protein
MNEKMRPLELSDLHALGPYDRPGDIILIDKAPHISVLSLCSENDVKHVVQTSNIKSTAEIDFSSQMVQSPSNFFTHPLSCIFGIPEANAENEQMLSSLSFSVQSLTEQKDILASFESFIKKLTPSPALLNDILTVVDEALTNAVFNAPFAGGTATAPPRNEVNVPIDPDKKPYLFAGHDSERVIVGCRDSYGSLKVPDLLKRIKTCYQNNVGDVINYGEGGAGIGSFMMFESCASMYIGVDSGSSTTICCSFPLKLSATKRGQLPKNIHVIHR